MTEGKDERKEEAERRKTLFELLPVSRTRS